MARHLLITVLLLGLCASVASAQGGSISDFFVPDARSLGMGRAFTSIASGPAAAYWNPAALGLGRPGHLISLGSAPYVRLLPGFQDDIFLTTGSLMWQSQRIGLGGNFNYVDYGVGDPEFTFESSFESTAHAGIGVEVLRWPFVASTAAREATGPEVRLGLGANLKRYHIQLVSSPLPDFFAPPLMTATEYDMDVGLLLVACSRNTPLCFTGIRFGAVVSNVLDRELVFDADLQSPLGRSLRTGFTVEGAMGPQALCGPLLEARGSIETVHFFGKVDVTPQIMYGAELVAAGLLALRIGFSDFDDDFDESTAGLGIAWNEDDRWGFALDAANLPAVDGFISNSRTQYAASAWYRFGASAEPGGL